VACLEGCKKDAVIHRIGDEPDKLYLILTGALLAAANGSCGGLQQGQQQQQWWQQQWWQQQEDKGKQPKQPHSPIAATASS
jgi:hypothetical protein